MGFSPFFFYQSILRLQPKHRICSLRIISSAHSTKPVECAEDKIVIPSRIFHRRPYPSPESSDNTFLLQNPPLLWISACCLF